MQRMDESKVLLVKYLVGMYNQSPVYPHLKHKTWYMPVDATVRREKSGVPKI